MDGAQSVAAHARLINFYPFVLRDNFQRLQDIYASCLLF